MEKLGILAGSGALPFKVATNASKKYDVFVIAYAGAAEKNMRDFPNAEFSLLQVNSVVKKLKEEGCKKLVLIGKVLRPAAAYSTTEQDLIADIPAKLLMMIQENIIRLKQNSDDAMLTTFIDYLEKFEKFEIIGAEKIYPDLTMKAGFLSGSASEENEEDIKLGIKIAKAMGDLNVGQSVVVSQGIVLAVEACEGTDKMLDRVKTLPSDFRGTPENPLGVLVKLPRAHQNLKIDMPTVGVETVKRVKEANLAGIVVKENNVLIDDKEAIKKAAEKNNIFIQAVKIK